MTKLKREKEKEKQEEVPCEQVAAPSMRDDSKQMLAISTKMLLKLRWLIYTIMTSGVFLNFDDQS